MLWDKLIYAGMKVLQSVETCAYEKVDIKNNYIDDMLIICKCINMSYFFVLWCKTQLWFCGRSYIRIEMKMKNDGLKTSLTDTNKKFCIITCHKTIINTASVTSTNIRKKHKKLNKLLMIFTIPILKQIMYTF